jgi:hypothetical protein
VLLDDSGNVQAKASGVPVNGSLAMVNEGAWGQVSHFP